MKPVKTYQATVEQQFPANQEVAVLKKIGYVYGTHAECWTQAKAMCLHPILTFKELDHVQ